MNQLHYPDAPSSPDFAALEQSILAGWQAQSTFAASVASRPSKQGGASNEFVFYDGPPFANGLPHYGHLLTGYVKDLFARYQTMKGKRVERRFGWDCHGLPAEMGAEKELKISGRQAIQNYGIQNFNEYCRTSVMKYAGEWEAYVNRQARWVDFANDYKTMNRDYMESVLWAFKQLFDKGWVYESYRVMPYSWAAETPLSNFETKLDNSYRSRTDKAVTVKFKLKDKPKGAPDADAYYVLAWTTTPWTLPSNLALAVSGEMEYSFVPRNRTCVIVANSALKAYGDILGADEGCEIGEGLDSISGADLIGLTYEPLFPYFADQPKSFRILDGSSFIEEGSGTGVVHMAPGFGEDDQRVCVENGIELVVPVDEQGKYTDEIFDIEGLSLKGLNVIADTRKSDSEPYSDDQLKKYGLANLRIITWLKEHDRLVKQDDYAHNYPHCWRTDTPIIYRAMSSWYVAVTKFRDRAVELNRNINWIPHHIRDGQMEHMLSTAPDWSISRNRFWGTPIPIWRTESGKTKAFGSIAELEEFFGVKVEDLHRPYIDELVKEEGGETWRRVTDVFDCWFESGSMPFAQVHYPFENKEWFESHFPADFITEYVGQTRGWFNTLIMLSTALFDKEPFRNCICHGVVIDEETGLKYSKRLKNYKDPMEVFEKFGADALRWLMMSSPVMRGADLGIDPEGKFIHDAIRLYIKPIWNAYYFFTLYANADGVKAEFNVKSDNLMDRYILAKCAGAVKQFELALDGYDAPAACQAVTDFVEVLNNWYIRRNKDRFWGAEQSPDKQAAYNTLYSVLHILTRAAAPLLPMVCESVYQGLTGEDSVHLADFPDMSAIAGEAELVADMDRVRDACNAILSIRNAKNIRVRQPLLTATLYGAGANRLRNFESLIADEVNVKAVQFSDDLESVADQKLTIHFPVAGKRLGAKMKAVGAAAKSGDWKLDAGTIIVGGEALQDGEYVMQLQARDNAAGNAQALASNDALVVLDLNITPDLEAEGLARDLVRMIQQARKDAGLHVSDRIKLVLDVPESAGAAVDAHKDYISQQVLAVSLVRDNAGAAAHKSEQQLDGKPVVIGFEVAA